MATILIVDDEQANRELIAANLDGSGHTLFEADTGLKALEVAASCNPDLVLLDVMMPELDGFEVTRRLRRAPATAFVPIVLITALGDREARITGLDAGADEFLTKPIDGRELSIRTGNLLRLRARERALLQRNIELLELHRLRDETVALLVHDIKGPLGAMGLNLAYIGTEPQPYNWRDALDDLRNGNRRMMRLVQGLLDAAKAEKQGLTLDRQRLVLPEVISPVLQARWILAKTRGLNVEVQLTSDAQVPGDSDLLTRVFENLIDNALRHTQSQGQIKISSVVEENAVTLRLANTGAPIPAEDRLRLFDRFISRSNRAAANMNYGLGLYFCRMAVEAHSGSIWIEDEPEYPVVFCVRLPRAVA